MPDSSRKRQPRNAEAAILREVQQFMRRTAAMLQRLLAPSQALRKRLMRTDAYKRVDGLDEASHEPAWDLAGTLEVLLEDDVRRMIGYLRTGARRVRIEPHRRG